MRTLLSVLIALLLLGCGTKQVSYKDEIQPILNAHCVKCHGGEKTRGKINLSTYEACIASRSVTDQAPIVTPGNTSTSRLYILSATEQVKYRMPPDTFHLTPIPAEKLVVLGKWIMQGAKDN